MTERSHRATFDCLTNTNVHRRTNTPVLSMFERGLEEDDLRGRSLHRSLKCFYVTPAPEEVNNRRKLHFVEGDKKIYTLAVYYFVICQVHRSRLRRIKQSWRIGRNFRSNLDSGSLLAIDYFMPFKLERTEWLYTACTWCLSVSETEKLWLYVIPSLSQGISILSEDCVILAAIWLQAWFK